MAVFRNHTPLRRDIQTIVTNYREHKPDLKIDYVSRCGYCNSADTWRFAWFEIDHFVPQKYLIKVTDTEYSNLVYACRSCNNAKRAKWPTADEKKHNENNEGFIDPCDAEYNNQFSRFDDGRIKPETLLGKWMYDAMKMYKPQHEIIWNIELLDSIIEEIENLLSHSEDDALSKKLLDSYRGFRTYVNQLGNI